jgi:hypothetical protein
MGRAINLLHSEFLKIRDKPELLLDYEFVVNIFQPLYPQLPEFCDHMDYFKEQKEGKVIGSSKLPDHVLVIDKAMGELFWPTKQRNLETPKSYHELVVGVAHTLLMELEDVSKATFEYLLTANEQYRQAIIDKGKEMTTLGMHANNDPSEGNFAVFTGILCSRGGINLSSASGIGQM